MKSYPLLANTSEATSKQLQALEGISGVFQKCYFIADTERMEESPVVMKLLHQFQDKFIIVFSSKISGGCNDGTYKQTCYKIQNCIQPKN